MYAPIFHPASGMWLVGRIEDHQAKPLGNLVDIERACKILNEHEAGTKTAVHRVVKDPPKDETVAWDKDGREIEGT